MARKKTEVRIINYGRYTPFVKGGKELPKIVEFTTEIPARLEVEFGMILEIRKARGERLEFVIDHPSFRNDDGTLAPPFTGELRITDNEYRFFLGDTFWPPLEDKIGPWRLQAFLGGEVVADKTFNIVPDPQAPAEP